jgi:hypothetical protein
MAGGGVEAGALVGCGEAAGCVGLEVGCGDGLGGKVTTTVGTDGDVAVGPGTFVGSGTLVVGTGVRVGGIGVGVGTAGVSVERVDGGAWLERTTSVPVGVTVGVRGSVVVIPGEAVVDG